MSIYSLKMRASRHENGTQEHVSGAEKILRASELTEQMDALLQRALHHAKGKADFVNLKIEEIQPENLQYLDALPVSTYEAATADEGRKAMAEGLTEVGITPEKAEKIMSMFTHISTFPPCGTAHSFCYPYGLYLLFFFTLTLKFSHIYCPIICTLMPYTKYNLPTSTTIHKTIPRFAGHPDC